MLEWENRGIQTGSAHAIHFTKREEFQTWLLLPIWAMAYTNPSSICADIGGDDQSVLDHAEAEASWDQCHDGQVSSWLVYEIR